MFQSRLFITTALTGKRIFNMNTQESVRSEVEPQAVEFVVRAKELELILRRAPVEPDDEFLAPSESFENEEDRLRSRASEAKATYDELNRRILAHRASAAN